MSIRYKGGILSATPPTLVAGAGASGAWTLEQQMQANAAGNWPINGPFYVEEVFSTYLYTGNDSTQTITNGIDLSTYGGLVWIKNRAGFNHNLQSTGVGFSNAITSSATTYASTTDAITGFNTTGFNLGSGVTYAWTNNGGSNYVSWSFRKQAKFFDVVTWTGDGTAGRTISHNLGSVPGAIFVKRLSNGYNWEVYHTSIGNNKSLVLNDVAAATTRSDWNNTTPTSTQFTVGSTPEVNASGGSYVAYLFAHDAGGFGLTGTDNVISCGSFTGNTTVNLGYEPQWIMIKKTNEAGSWTMWDTMRGWSQTQQLYLYADLSNAESSSSDGRVPNATGFTTAGYTPTDTFIYIAIRRGPMKVPTSGTSVFAPATRTGEGSPQTVSGLSFSPDLWMTKNRGNTQNNWSFDRLRGPNQPLSSNLTADEATNTLNWFGGTPIFTPTNTGFKTIGQAQVNTSSGSYIDWLFGRAPSFFDEVCYTGVFTAQTINHNLTVAPEMIITKKRSSTSAWPVYHIGVPSPQVNQPNLNETGGYYANNWYPGAPTSTTFTVQYQDNGSTYVAYLFATCAGVSKVGSYTGTGALQTVNCGFTTGARFVLIKRTDSTGDWWTYDSARGISSSSDPYLLLNSTAAEVTGTNYVDTDATGFKVTAAAPAGLNASGGTYIFLAIA